MKDRHRFTGLLAISDQWLCQDRRLLMLASAIDLDRLLKLSVAIGRMGESDRAAWWNTKGQLGTTGARAVSRGFPRTHYFAQARAVLAVADERFVALPGQRCVS